jgi:transposase
LDWIVANAHKVHLIYGGNHKTVRLDAEALARLARRDPALLHGLEHRGEQAHQDLAVIRARETRNPMLRRLLVQAAHYQLGTFGPDTDLRRWGLARAERGGKIAKRKAVIAVARKLAVLLHRLWVTAEVYEPLRTTTMTRRAA